VRRAILFAILAACLGVGVLPALAADTTVNAGVSSWAPSEFAVKPGETVTWVNASGVVHDLWVDGTPVKSEGAAWTYGPQTFAERANPYTFRCSLHPGMTGRFYVNASGAVPSPTPAPSATATPTASPTASATPTAGPSPAGPAGAAPATGPASGGGAGAGVTAFRARAARRRFCTRRSARCRRPGVFLVLDLAASDTVRVRGTLRRGGRRVRAASLLVAPGHRRVRLRGRRLRAGRYALTLRAGGITRRVRFSVRRA